MKTNWLVGPVFLAGAMLLRAQTNDLNAALRQGLFEEEANRNLDAAISNYQALAAQFDQDRQVAATAIFRLGECYRKLGQTNDAVAQYQRIVREFPDQPTLATLSRQNLTGMGTTPPASSSSAIVAGSVAPLAQAAGLEAEAASLQAQIERLSGLNREDQRIAVQQNFSNPVLTKLMQQLNEAEQNLASLTNNYTPEDLHVVNANVLVNTINNQVDVQVDGVIKGLQAKKEADLNAAKALREQSGPASAAHMVTATTTDDEDGEIRRIQQLIQNSPDLINAARPGALTPLRTAAGLGQIKVATFLLDHGAGVNVDQGDGVTALHDAAGVGNRAMAELLLSRGADVNATASNGQTPLCFAVDKGFPAVTEVLLANKADVNIPGKNTGNTPLHLAARNGQAKIIQLLLAAGANPNAENKEGRTPLSFAAGNVSLEAVKMLLNAKADPNGGKLDAPLFCALKGGNTNLVELLLRAGADPNRSGRLDGYVTGYAPDQITTENPLTFSCRQNQPAMVRLLLQAKANPNGKDATGLPFVFRALDNLEVLKLMLEAGTDPNSVEGSANNGFGSEGESVLMVAAKNRFSRSPDGNSYSVSHDGDPAAARLLVDHGANVNARRPSDGATVLHLAVQSGNREIVGLLLANQAEVNVRNNDGFTPLDYAKRNLPLNATPSEKTNADEITDLLRQHGALDNLPHWDRITVSRPSANYSKAVFYKGTNDWNRFSLLETLLSFYSEQSFNPLLFRGGAGSEISLPFPDLTRVTIIRHRQNTTNEAHIKVDLIDSTNGLDCAKDVPLEFGDVVEFPEREHALGDQPVGLTDSQRNSIVNGLKGSVRLLVHGGKTELPVYPNNSSLIGSALNLPEAQGILLSSSDLSRVKVTRLEPVTGRKREWILDCSRMSKKSNPSYLPGQTDNPHYNAPDFRLRNGDVIEVPEKQN